MISLKRLSLSRGSKLLFAEVDQALHVGQRVGIVGKNGTGKSSLFALLRGELHQDAGDLDVPPRWVIASVAQETPATDRAAIDYVLDGDECFRAAERAIAEAEHHGDGTKLAEAHSAYDEAGGYTARARAAQIMHGLGFDDSALESPVTSFSGGWRVRLNLARALTCQSDLLLLDEPTNHLDLDAVIWLEEWLRAYSGTLLVISHDRDFLDAVAQNIWHLEDLRIRRYAGGYSDFEQQRAQELSLRQAMFDKQQREIAHLQSFIDRFRAKATKARAAQSRIKALERMERITAAHVDSPFSFQLREPATSSRVLVSLDQVAVGYGERVVLSGIKLEIEAGARIALLGRNGAGKSTFVKLIAQQLNPFTGTRVFGKHLKVGYFAQHQLEQLSEEASPLLHLRRIDPATRDQELRDFLGGFNFRGEMVDAPVATFSGGEKARLSLALIVWQRPNLLLLDEPTNHLDLDMRHALNMALQEYEGALVLVSHDRHLLRSSAEEFFIVSNGRVQRFDGDLDDYRVRLREDDSRSDVNDAKPVSSSRRDDRRREAQERQQRSQMRKPFEAEIAKLEQRMEELNRQKSAVDAVLADGEIYLVQRKAELQTQLQRQAELDRELQQSEERWLHLHTQLESLVDQSAA